MPIQLGQSGKYGICRRGKFDIGQSAADAIVIGRRA